MIKYKRKAALAVLCTLLLTGCGQDLAEIKDNATPNSEPVINQVLLSATQIKANESVEIIVDAQDAENDNLTYHFVGDGEFTPQVTTMGISSQSAKKINWTPPGKAKKYEVIISVSDEENIVFTTENVEVIEEATPTEDTTTPTDNETPIEPEVPSESVEPSDNPTEPTNTLPIINSISGINSQYSPGETMTFTINASDADGDTLSFAITGDGTLISENDGVVNWTVPQSPGDYALTVIVSDGKDVISEVVQFSVIYVNTPPVIDSISGIKSEYVSGELIEFSISSSDSDGDVLSYSVIGEGALIEQNGGSFKWKAPDNPGIYGLTLMVSDGTDQTSQQIAIEVASNQILDFFTTGLGSSRTVIRDIDLSGAIAARLNISSFDIDDYAETRIYVNDIEVAIPAGLLSNGSTVNASIDLDINNLNYTDNTIKIVFADNLGGTTGGFRIESIDLEPVYEIVAPEEVRAFPGAEGFGKDSVGGRGGSIIEVTNLNDSGTGSLRTALQASGKRTIIFRVGGTISLASNIKITNPYITIAGQTAPGDGITIKGAAIILETHDVIIRNLRIRVGNAPEGHTLDNRDGLGMQKANEVYNVIIDHCSISWGVDENVSTWYALRDITIQWSITSEALLDAGHSKGEHGMGLLIGDDAQNVSVHHNLFAHNMDRNPLFKHRTSGEIINNVVYNWKWFGAYFAGSSGAVQNNIIGNTFIGGADTQNAYGISMASNLSTDSKIYLEGNVGSQKPSSTSGDEWAIVRDGATCKSKFESISKAVNESGINTQSAESAYELVLNNAGAKAPNRDSIDSRVISDVRNRTGAMINSQDEVGGWENFANGTAPTDSDHDGMPDSWETARGLNPGNSADRNNLAPSGYTWVEEYINSLITMP